MIFAQSRPDGGVKAPLPVPESLIGRMALRKRTVICQQLFDAQPLMHVTSRSETNHSTDNRYSSIHHTARVCHIFRSDRPATASIDSTRNLVQPMNLCVSTTELWF